MAENRADVYIHRGLSEGVDRFLHAMEKRKEEEKNAAREFKALSEFAEVNGWLTKDQATVMDRDALKGFVEGKMYEQGENRKRLQDAAIMEDIAQAQQQASAMEALKRFGGGYARSALGDYYERGDASQPFPNAAQALYENPEAITAGQFPSILNQLTEFAPQNIAPAFFEDASSGNRFAVRGNTMLPSGMNPAKNVPRLINVGGAQMVQTGPRSFSKISGGGDDKQSLAVLNAKLRSIANTDEAFMKVEDKLKAIAKLADEIEAKKPRPDSSPSRGKLLGDAKKVKVKRPDGQEGWIPESELEQAKKAGYTVIE